MEVHRESDASTGIAFFVRFYRIWQSIFRQLFPHTKKPSGESLLSVSYFGTMTAQRRKIAKSVFHAIIEVQASRPSKRFTGKAMLRQASLFSCNLAMKKERQAVSPPATSALFSAASVLSQPPFQDGRSAGAINVVHTKTAKASSPSLIRGFTSLRSKIS